MILVLIVNYIRFSFYGVKYKQFSVVFKINGEKIQNIRNTSFQMFTNWIF